MPPRPAPARVSRPLLMEAGVDPRVKPEDDGGWGELCGKDSDGGWKTMRWT
ncbi:hypothetical protein ACD589_03925 [Rhizobium sp. 814_E9_N1_1]|uniref:hypothetical protein n=1 Tax=unclassified Rhizobium TaxID=2613769 RepID=UPI003F2461C3